MPSNLPRFTLRIPRVLLLKISYIAEESGRSSNKEIEVLLREHVKNYETQNGEIPLDQH
ncbi:Arc family DNA-binding protein, partial [bacterium AH-315-E09]|nr:Arc family DNA-binding protein [bacterium AH-315-E09]